MKTLITQEKPNKLKYNTGQISHTLKKEPEKTKMKKLKRFIPLLFDLALTTEGIVLFKYNSCYWKYLDKDNYELRGSSYTIWLVNNLKKKFKRAAKTKQDC